MPSPQKLLSPQKPMRHVKSLPARLMPLHGQHERGNGAMPGLGHGAPSLGAIARDRRKGDAIVAAGSPPGLRSQGYRRQ